MILFLRDEMQDNHADTNCCAILTNHIEFFADRIELVYPRGRDVTTMQVVPANGDICFRWNGETYEFASVYDDNSERMLRDEFPNCHWFDEKEKV